VQPPSDPVVATEPAFARVPLSRRGWLALVRWFDAGAAGAVRAPRAGIDWARILPFVGMHLACVGVLWVGWSPLAIAVATALYVVRMFAITGFYHRYFSHRTFRTTRALQFVFALLGASCVQRGPLWWAAHHRQHHAHSDRPEDPHSPRQHGFLWSHMGWFLSREHFVPDLRRVGDLARYPELRWLDRFDICIPVALAALLYSTGAWLRIRHPELGTSAGQLLVWGFFISTVAVYHVTYTINSLCHVWGSRRYATNDGSRNNPLLALITFGEGWHNNHHHYPAAARQGFYWWEIDLTFYALRALAACGLIWDLRPVPERIRSIRPRA
jgi:stearoyl-CoA desaturase (delta-9 desaturase)